MNRVKILVVSSLADDGTVRCEVNGKEVPLNKMGAEVRRLTVHFSGRGTEVIYENKVPKQNQRRPKKAVKRNKFVMNLGVQPTAST